MKTTHQTESGKRCGIFFCQNCKTQCAAQEAVSHCCHAPILLQPHVPFPFICSCCNGECELGNPQTPTVEQMVDAKILEVLDKLKYEKLTVDQAWVEIVQLVDEEIESVMRNQIEGIANSVKATTLPVEMGEYVLRGFDVAKQAFVRIIEQALPPDK